jgi:fructokinase
MKADKKLKAVCYGEVLWDVFDNEKKIGGAPLNVALRMQSLGCSAAMISCVGNDADGNGIIDYVSAHGLDTRGIIRTNTYPTGVVQVFLNKSVSASYDIRYPAAWDKIILNSYALNLVADADVLVYGSLVTRDAVSKQALVQLLKNNVYKVFDVNLRKPHYNMQTLEELMLSADFIKFNDEELHEIAGALGSAYTQPEDNMAFMAGRANVQGMCVTRGAEGALLMWQGHLYQNGGYPVKVADTVGAGDSFLATLITGLLTGGNPQKAIDTACAMGALVASKPGANPNILPDEIKTIMQSV